MDQEGSGKVLAVKTSHEEATLHVRGFLSADRERDHKFTAAPNFGYMLQEDLEATADWLAVWPYVIFSRRRHGNVELARFRVISDEDAGSRCIAVDDLVYQNDCQNDDETIATAVTCLIERWGISYAGHKCIDASPCGWLMPNPPDTLDNLLGMVYEVDVSGVDMLVDGDSLADLEFVPVTALLADTRLDDDAVTVLKGLFNHLLN